MFGTASCGRPFTEPRDRNLDSLYQVTYISFNVISESFVINQNNTFWLNLGTVTGLSHFLERFESISYVDSNAPL